MNMKYQQWLDCPGMNEELLGQLKAMNEEQISDSFYRELAFGTGGLRGVLGAGTNPPQKPPLRRFLLFEASFSRYINKFALK